MSCTVSGEHRQLVDANPDEVWQAMRRYGDLSWAEGIDRVVTEGEGVGMLRKVQLAGSSTWILERLTMRDDQARTFSYAIEGDGMPGLDNYHANVRAEPAGTGCMIHWQCRAEVSQQSRDSMQPVVEALAEGICTLFASQFGPGQSTADE